MDNPDVMDWHATTPPTFNPGRRRNFDEFAVDDQEITEREHQPLNPQNLQSIPTVITQYAANVMDALNEYPNHPPSPPHESTWQREYREMKERWTWQRVIIKALYLGTLVIALVSKELVRGTYNAGRYAYSNRHVRYTFTAAVQTSNAVKRRLVSITTTLPTKVRRRFGPQSPPRSRRSRSPPHMTSSGALIDEERRARRKFLDSIQMQDIQFTEQEDLAAMMEDIESDVPRHPYVMTGATQGSSQTSSSPTLINASSASPGASNSAAIDASAPNTGVSNTAFSRAPFFTAASSTFSFFNTATPRAVHSPSPFINAPSSSGFSASTGSEVDKLKTDEPASILSKMTRDIAIEKPKGWNMTRDPSSSSMNTINASSLTQSSLNILINPSDTTPNTTRDFTTEKPQPWNMTQGSSNSQINMINNSLLSAQPSPKNAVNSTGMLRHHSNPEAASIDESTISDEMDENMSDTSDDQVNGFQKTLDSKPCAQLQALIDEELKIKAKASKAGLKRRVASKNIQVSRSHKSDKLPSVLRSTGAKSGIRKHQSFSQSVTRSGLDTPKRSPKKSVAFFVSPRTGRPITKTKKFIYEESMDFPVSSSPPYKKSSLSINDCDSLLHSNLTYPRKAAAHTSSTESLISGVNDALSSPAVASAPSSTHQRSLVKLFVVDPSSSAPNVFTPFPSSPIDDRSLYPSTTTDNVALFANPPEENASALQAPSTVIEFRDTQGRLHSYTGAQGYFDQHVERNLSSPHQDSLRNEVEFDASAAQNPTKSFEGNSFALRDSTSALALKDFPMVSEAGCAAVLNDTSAEVTACSLVVEADRPAVEEEAASIEGSHALASGQNLFASDDEYSDFASLDLSDKGRETGRKKSQTRKRSAAVRRKTLGTPRESQGAIGFNVAERRHSQRIVKEAQEKEDEKKRQLKKKLRELEVAIVAEERARQIDLDADEEARKAKAAADERQKQGVRRIPTENIIQPLDAAWNGRVQQALDTRDMSQVLVTLSSGAALTRKDLGTLKVVPGRDPAHGWLNDEIIAACLHQVVEYGLRVSNHQAGETPKFHAFNTFFYKNLRDKGAQSIKRWAAKAKIGKEDLLKVERVFIPVHQGAHWTLLVVSPLARTIEYFDSMGGRADSYIRNAKLWLREELGKSWKEGEWSVPTGSFGAGPRQLNGSDCGVFTCTTARMVVLGVDPMSYGGEDMEVQRGRMVAELLNGGLVGEFEPRVVR